MYKIIGNKADFAIEVDIIHFLPSIFVKSALWLGGERVGEFHDSENVLGPFMWSLHRIITERYKYWDSELEGLNCAALFSKILPFLYSDYFDLTSEEQEIYDKYSHFLISLGENFDPWIILTLGL